MKVVFICSTLERTGPTNQLLNIIKNLKSTIDFKLITLSKEPNASLKSSFIEQGVNVTCANINDLKFIQSLRLVKYLVDEENPDIVHSQGIRADVFSSILFKNNLSTLRNYPFEDYPPLYGKLKGNIMASVHLLSLFFIKKLVTVSNSTKNKNEVVPWLKFDTIYNGVDINKFSLSASDKVNKIKQKYSVKSDKKTLIYTGPLIERKNVSALIDSVKGNKDVQLLIVGDGPLMHELKQLSSIGDIIFVGAVDNVNDFLSIADCYVMLSKSEGFPNSVMEALSVGLPCILSNIPSHQDVHRIIGDSVKLCETDESFHDFLDSELDLFLKSKNKNNIRESAIKKISSDVMAEKYYSIYKEIIK